LKRNRTNFKHCFSAKEAGAIRFKIVLRQPLIGSFAGSQTNKPQKYAYNVTEQIIIRNNPAEQNRKGGLLFEKFPPGNGRFPALLPEFNTQWGICGVS
jgi:hypothetical protein